MDKWTKKKQYCKNKNYLITSVFQKTLNKMKEQQKQLEKKMFVKKNGRKINIPLYRKSSDKSPWKKLGSEQ